MKIVAIDFETANSNHDSACAVGLVRIVDGTIQQEESYFIRPPSRRFTNTHIHRITWDDVRDEPSFQDIWVDFNTFTKNVDYLVAHNAGFDRSVLRTCCQTYGLRHPNIPFINTVKIARIAWGIRPTNLPNVCDYLGIPLMGHHNAAVDAMACANILIRAIDEGVEIEEGLMK